MPRIPKVLHYTFGMAEGFGGKPWSLVHHVCLKSAVERIRPDKVLFHHQFEPTGPWWALSRSLVDLAPVIAPTEIFGRPLLHVAHQSDVVRLERLIEQGGIYLDTDILVQRDFDDLLDHSTVLGREGSGSDFGLANAAILAEPGAPFLRRWLEQYRSFRSKGRDEFWNEHSVVLPARLAKEFPQEVTLLVPTAFYWPLWTNDGLDLLFQSTERLATDGAYGHHLWESRAWSFLQNLTPGDVRRSVTNFNLWARPFLAGLPDEYGAPSIKAKVDAMRHKAWHRLRLARDGLRRRVHDVRTQTGITSDP